MGVTAGPYGARKKERAPLLGALFGAAGLGRRKRDSFRWGVMQGPHRKAENTVCKQSFRNKYFLNSLVNMH